MKFVHGMSGPQEVGGRYLLLRTLAVTVDPGGYEDGVESWKPIWGWKDPPKALSTHLGSKLR